MAHNHKWKITLLIFRERTNMERPDRPDCLHGLHKMQQVPAIRLGDLKNAMQQFVRFIFHIYYGKRHE